MYIDTATSMLPLLPILQQTNTVKGFSSTVTKLSSHITRAESIVNTHIVRRYDVSGFSAGGHPPVLKTLTEDIAAYYYLRPQFTGDNQNDNEWVEKYLDAKEILKDLKEGNCDLIDENNAVISERTDANEDRVESNVEDYTPTFMEDDTLSQKIDSDKISDIADSRD
jgi:hypothetical protein